jgi:hypothetical protein
MRPTGWRILLTLAVGATVVGWFFARMLDNRRGALSLPPWSAGVVLTACGIALIFTARRTHARLVRRPGTTPLPPLVAARLAALGVAGSRAGALVGGIYLGYIAYAAGGLETDFRTEIFWRGALCVAGSALVVVGALLLERVLRLPDIEDDDLDEARDERQT